jgi:endonuclease/exonuclease/phosphatase family metal-dependent hydrolase
MFRLMTYNVRYFGHQNPMKGARSTRRGLRDIAAALGDLGELPHVIGLQEVEARSFRSHRSHTPGEPEETQLGSLTRQLNHELSQRRRVHRYVAMYFPAHSYELGSTRLYTTGLALLVRDDVGFEVADPIREVTARREHPLARFKQSRICAHLRVRAPDGSDIDVFNTHLSLPQFFSPQMLNGRGRLGWGRNQLAEVQALARFVHERRSSDRFVVVGDFNAQPGSPAYDAVRTELDVDDAAARLFGVEDADLKLRWPSAGFFHLRMRLDHVFVGRGLAPVDLEDTEPYGVPGRWHGLSDHVPQVGRVALA